MSNADHIYIDSQYVADGVSQVTCIGVGAGHILTDASRLILIGRDVGSEITSRPDTFEEFVEAVKPEGGAIICWTIPMLGEGLDFWCAVRRDEAIAKGLL